MNIKSSTNMRVPNVTNKLVFLVLVICSVAFLQLCGGINVNSTRGYVFTAPKVLLAGETERCCLSLHNLEPPVNVLLELLSPREEQAVLSKTSSVIETGVETCLELTVPPMKQKNGILRIKIVAKRHNYEVTSEEPISIEPDSFITFVETDKAIYKPGQDVNIRILSLKRDLKPWKESIPKVWIENPSGIRVAQWTNVSTENGMAQLLFPLSVEPKMGNWKIEVKRSMLYPELSDSVVFAVRKYVLPRFQLTIEPLKFILADAKNVTWTICAKYSYGKPVKGTLQLSAISLRAYPPLRNPPVIRYEREMNSSSGCIDFSLTASSLGLVEQTPDQVFLLANFTEAGTGVLETAGIESQVMHEALKLEFDPHTPLYFKPGLPYHGKLRVVHLDNSPAAFKNIQLCLRNKIVECRNLQSGVDGFIHFVVQAWQKTPIKLIATAVDYPTTLYLPKMSFKIMMVQPTARFDVKPWYSPSNSYLTVAGGYQPIECGEKYSFNVMYTVPVNEDVEPIFFHYSINSKEDLLIYGHLKLKPGQDSILKFSEFNNLLSSTNDPTNETVASVVHRFPLGVKITPSMAPVSDLLLYYVRSDGEVVATTYRIQVGHCFENKVKTAWHSDFQAPGSTTQYHVEAAPWSLCGVSTVDKSTRFLAGSRSTLIKADQVFDKLKWLHPIQQNSENSFLHCGPTPSGEVSKEFDHLSSPAMNFDVSLSTYLRMTGYRSGHEDVHYVDAKQAFNDFGTIVMSDLKVATLTCWSYWSMQPRFFNNQDRSATAFSLSFKSSNMVSIESMDNLVQEEYVDPIPNQAEIIRSYFPETWLWELVPTGLSWPGIIYLSLLNLPGVSRVLEENISSRTWLIPENFNSKSCKKEGKVTIERILPHTITNWIGYTTCISPVHGLGIAPPTMITAFQPFFLDYTLPYSVKRGELLRLKVSLFNYRHHSLPVKITLEEAPGLALHSSSSSASFCVKQRDSVVHEFVLRPSIIGEVNITVSASVDSQYSNSCGPDTIVYARDVIVKPILILPEGFPVEVTKSALMCPKDFNDDSSIVWDLILPENVIPDSGRAYINLKGDILGPAVENLDSLVKLPVGCGEQNMVLMVPNIHVIKYLEAIKVENPALRERAIRNIQKGYQRELNYRHPDGSYSAFGPDSSGSVSSTWLTAFVLKSFAQARSLIAIDDDDLKLSAEGILEKQQENGCFPFSGTIFHKHMKGGLQHHDNSVALTAYILISLVESKVPISQHYIDKALNCMHGGFISLTNDPYILVIATYAVILTKHRVIEEVTNPRIVETLMNLSTRHNDLLWWEHHTKNSLSLSIEMTAYVILTLVELGGEENMVHASKAVRWLSKQRNAEGGFVSTQDTVLGLEALTKYAAAVNTNNTNLSILVIAGTVEEIYTMHNNNRMVLTQIPLPVLPTLVEIFAEGEGCVLVQSNMKYNVAHITGSEAFDLAVHAKSVPYANECSVQEITVCGRYLMTDEESNMALIEIEMISGYVPTKESLHMLLKRSSSKVKRFEENRGVVTLYFDKLTNKKTCVSFMVEREVIVDRLEPANVKLYDYYRQEFTVSKSYKFAEICSSADPSEMQPNPEVMPKGVRKNDSAMDLMVHHLSFLEGILNSNKSTEKFSKESQSATNKLQIKVNETNDKSTSLKRPHLVNDLIDNLGRKRNMQKDLIEDEVSISGVQTNVDNVPFVEKTNLKINDDSDLTAHVLSSNDNRSVNDELDTPQVEFGSGLTPDSETGALETVLGSSPFVVINHELETPEGMEGPVPVYVKPDTPNFKTETTTGINGFSELTQAPQMEIQSIPWREPDGSDDRLNKTTKDEQHLSSPTRVKHMCPTCADKLPSDISDVYCSASNAFKVAIRRRRIVLLLLDLHMSREVRRVHARIDLVLPANCSCTPLDSPGSLMLIMSKGDDLLASRDHKQTLNDSFYIYGVPSVSGEPAEVTEARLVCSNREKNRSAHVDPPLGD